MDREKIENNRETIEKDRLENISRKILVMARNELYMHQPRPNSSGPKILATA